MMRRILYFLMIVFLFAEQAQAVGFPKGEPKQRKTDDSTVRPSSQISVEPASGSYIGGCGNQEYVVNIRGAEFGNGWDITKVTICGVEVCQIVIQSANSVVVYPGAGTPGTGDIVIISKSKGKTTIKNGFTYLEAAPGKPAKEMKYPKVSGTSIEIN